MSLFSQLSTPKAPGLPTAPKPAVPMALPKIRVPTAAGICKSYQPSAQGQALLQPSQTPAQYMSALEQKNLSTDQINLLSHGMPERESVHWACQSSRKVDGQLPPADKNALGAAEAWVKNPCDATKSQAATAASQTDYHGPGAWAAQGAAWSQSPGGTAPATGPTGDAVAGSVNIAAAMAAKPAVPAVPAAPALPTAPTLAAPKLAAPPAPTLAPPVLEVPPNVLEQQAKVHQPFIDLGKDVASGKNTWA
ncbi:MAG: hypothetical protein HZA90_09060 [Verrucomicrobia bacterium]|nr:hypothetical protein [Verrucomicrobiota bacterium]